MLDKTNDTMENIDNESVHLVISPSDLAKKTFLYANEIGFLEMKPYQSVSSERKDSFLLLFITFETGKLIYQNVEYQVKKGDLFLLDCKNDIKLCNTSEMRVLYVYFNGNQAYAYYDMIVKNKLLCFKIENYKTIMSLFFQILTLHRKNKKYAEQLTSLHLTRILTEISMLCDNESVSEVEYPEYINDIFHNVDHFYKQKFTLDMLAKKYSLNKFHLSREFKRCAGTTFNEYLITTRISKAKSLLRYSDKSIEQIADAVGFYNSSHFIKMFYSREHVTPLYYRKQWTT